jgi:hypothetical protein
MKIDLNQLELDFTTARKDLREAAERFDNAAGAWSNAIGNTLPEVAQQVHFEANLVRSTVKRLVGILVDQSGLPFHAAWVLAYHELFKASGYHPAAEGQIAATTVFLDRVQAAGKLEELQETVAEMLKDPRYAKK